MSFITEMVKQVAKKCSLKGNGVAVATTALKVIYLIDIPYLAHPYFCAAGGCVLFIYLFIFRHKLD